MRRLIKNNIDVPFYGDYYRPKHLRHFRKENRSQAKLIEFHNPCSMGKIVVFSAMVLTAYIAHQFAFLFIAKREH